MTALASTRPSLRKRLTSGPIPFLLSRLHSLSGIVFGGYVMAHLVVNATLVQGFHPGADRTVYQEQVDLFHSLPFLPLVRVLFIYLPIAYHTLYGLWLTYQAKPNVNQYPFGKNVFYAFQRLSALVLAVFIFWHITAMKGWWGLTLKFDPAHATESTVAHLSASWIIGWFVYPLGILAACFHLAYGFWTAAITWGLTVTARTQRYWGWVCVFLFAVSLIFGLTALIAARTPVAMAGR